MQNRRVMPELFFKDKVVRTTTPEENAKVSDAIARRKKFDEGKAKAQGAYKQILKEGAMKRSYTIDEMTVATLLKGHPQADEILDSLLKGKKKNESGEEFQDGSEDTIGGEGHEANLRGVDHKTGGGGHPGTSTKNASQDDFDLEKARRLDVKHDPDRPPGDPRGFRGVQQESDTDKPGSGTSTHSTHYDKYYDYDKKKGEVSVSPTTKRKAKGNKAYGMTMDDWAHEQIIPANAAHEKELKRASQDDFDLEKDIQIVGNFLMEKGYDLDQTNEIIEEYFGLEKSDNLADNLPEEFEDEMEDDDTIPAEPNAKKSLTADEEILSHLLKTMGSDRMEEILKAVIGGASIDPSKRRMLAQMPGAYKAAPADGEDNPLINRKVNPKALAALKQTVDSGGATKSEGDSDLEKSEENMEDYSLDFSKSILERMGLEKGATSVSKEAGGGKATQINYGTKPTTRFKHPKAKSDKKYVHNPAKGTVEVEKEGEKTRSIGVSEESKLKNASVNSADLYKALDAILDKKRD